MEAPTSRDRRSPVEEPPLKVPRLEEIDMLKSGMLNMNYLIRDPGLRPPITDYPIGERDEIRRAYIKLGPYQLQKSEYPFSGLVGYRRRFQKAWFKSFFWLEYSEKKDATFCLPCYLFPKKPIGRSGSDTFTVKGFNNWRKVNKGKECALVNHEGKTPLSAHMSGAYIDIIRSRRRSDNVTVEHHYQVGVFISAIDHQLQELNSRFSESVTELLSLTVALDPKDSMFLVGVGL